jgi:hypothetical protein
MRDSRTQLFHVYVLWQFFCRQAAGSEAFRPRHLYRCGDDV